MESLLDARINGYVLERVLAEGGMAAVLQGRHERTGQVVAIKVLARDLRNKRDPLARILQEGRAICSLAHEHVVRVLDYGVAEEGVGFIIMELLEGQTLAELLGEVGTIGEARVNFVARQICLGLAAAHARGIFHRDVKPANIMLVRGNRHRDFVKVLDFGIAKLSDEDPAKLAATATGMTLGTPQYMSPEQAKAGTIDARSDLYQLGLVMYELLTGAPPFDHRNPVRVMSMHLAQAPASIRALRPDVSPEFEALVFKCLAKEPEDRFPDADALRAELDRLSARRSAEEQRVTLIPGHDGDALGADLRLPTLGNPADLERYAHNLGEVLAQLWPEGVPEALRVIQGALWELTEEETRLGAALTLARERADGLANALEARQRPLERAVEALGEERAALGAQRDRIRAQEQVHRAQMRRLDAHYSELYEQVERHQSALYNSAPTGGPVDFRDLFREDISAQLGKLEETFRRRSVEAQRLNALRKEIAALMPRMADTDLQLSELKRSALGLEAERASRLAAKEFAVVDLENRHQAVERALAHRYLQLGLAFRRAISELIDSRG